MHAWPVRCTVPPIQQLFQIERAATLNVFVRRAQRWFPKGGTVVRWFALVLCAYVVSNVTLLPSQSAQKPPASPFSIPKPSERVEIDGSKNPELIPEWYVWETFFRQLHTAGTVPSALNLTESETRALHMEVEEFYKSNQQCQKQIENLRPLVGIASNSEVNQKQRSIQLECRNRSLDIRDRLLAGVRPEASVALVTWVESLKSGIEISVPKRELAHFRQPR